MKTKLKKFIVIALMAACIIACLSLGVANMKVSWADAEKTAIATSSETGTGEMGYVITDQNGEILETFDENGNVTGEDAESGIMTLDSYYDYTKDGVTWTWETVDGVRTWTSCSGYGSNLVVPSYDPEETTLNDYVSDPVIAVGDNFLEDDTKIKTVTFSEGYTRIIGRYAFGGCSKLESVDTGDSVTSIGRYAFSSCSKLESVTIGRNVTSIGNFAFRFSYALEEIYYNAKKADDISIVYDYEFGTFWEAGQSGSGITVTFGPDVTYIPSGLFCIGTRSDWNYALPKIKTIIFEDNSKLKTIEGYSFGSSCDTVDVYITDIVAWCETDFIESSNSHAGTTSAGTPFKCSNLYLNNQLVMDLVIPSGVTSISSNAFRSCYSIKSVVIPNGVTSIGDKAFYYCKYLESIEIPNGVTSINEYTFYECTSLTTAEIPNSVTSIGSRAFYDCTPLTSLTIPEKVASIGNYAFYGCTYLTKINFNAVAMDDLKKQYQVFGKAGQSGSGITVTIGKSVTKIPAYLFNSWDSTSSTYIINITKVKFEDGSKCESIGKYAFAYNCQNLKSITIPNSVTEIGAYAFYSTGLSSVVFEDPTGWYCEKCTFDSGSLSNSSTAATYLSSTYYSYAWYQELPEEFEYTLSSDGTYYILTKFNNKNNTYTDVVMDATYESLPVKEIAASVFEEHTEMTSVTIPENITTIGEYAFYKCTGLTSVTIPDSVTTIGEYAFDGCTGLTSLTIGEGVTSIGAYAFRCKYLTKINFNAVKMDDLSSKNQVFYNAGDSGSGIAVTIGANVTKIPAYLFFPYSTTLTAYTPSYTSVEFMSGSKCTSIGKYAFYSCSYLKSMEIPDSVTSIGNYAFYGCSGLTSLTIGEGVTSIGTYVFYKCSSLTSVTFKNTEGWSCSYGITTIDMDSSDLSNTSTAATYLTSTYYTYTWTRTEGAGFTYRLSSDGSYYILDSYVGRSTNVTVEGTHNGLPVKEIGPYAFEGNTRMMTVVILENVTAIGEGAFYCCSLLMSVDFPSTLVTIGDLAFAGCTLLLGVEFPSGLVSIGEGAFLECVCLMAVVFSSGLESIGEYAFAGTYLIQLYVDDLASFLAIDFADSFANPLSVLSENGGTFYVGGLETTKLTAINTAGVTRIGSYALAYCTIITDVALGEDVAYIGAHAFEGMSGLKSFTLSYYSGWTVYASSTLSSGTKITSDELEGHALTYFTSTYVSYVWRWAYVSNAAPVVECREVASGGYINCSFTVMVSVDASSSVWYIAYTDPTGATFTSYYDATWTITPAVNGTYEFVAVDTDGFVSETYYIIFDDTAPDLYLGGAAAWANYNSSEFSVLAVDNLDENVRLYYSLDGENGEWILCGSNPYTVTPDSKASTDGYWWFKAVDAAGNSTPAYRTVLDTVAVFGSWEFYDDMSLYFSYSAPSYTSWTCYVNGVEYSSGSPFSKDRTTYTAVLTSPNGSTLTAEKYLDHYFPDEGDVVDPTCQSMGYTIYTCVYCGETQLGNFLSACDHEYMEVTVEATCTTNGYSRAECIYCGGVKEGSYTPIYASGHSPVSGAYLAPTCTEPGYYGTVCEVCGAEIETTPIEALGHLLMTETVPSTCVSYGYSLTYCTRDGCDYSVRNGLSGTDAYLTDHVYGDVLRVSATCTDDGYTYEKCTVCGYEHTTILHATGHDFGQYYEAEDTETGLVTRWHTCKTCGFTESFELSNNADTAANGVIDIFQKYQKYMWWILLAFVGIWSIFIGLRWALSRNDEEKAKAKSMLANYILGLFVIAIVLVGLPYLIYGIAILVG